MRALPTATYRIQLGPQSGFSKVRGLLPYLRSLGVSTAYLSPVLQSVRGGHGYDVTDPRRPNEELGTEEELRGLCDAAGAQGMGLLLDIVPNHMAASTENPFWRDVLEKGRASRYARMFDIDWTAPEAEGKLVLPVLPSSLEQMASAARAGLEWAEDTGDLVLACGHLRVPLSPWSYSTVLWPDDAGAGHGSESGGREGESGPPRELAPALAAARRLPGPAAADQMEREVLEETTTALKLRLARGVRTSPAAAAYLGERLAAFSHAGAGAQGARRLVELAAAQPYRLLPWRSGSRIVNYRRFFDIADLVAVRQEEPGVFELTHGYLLDLLRHPAVAGFRVDHIDGLDDPRGYLERLRGEAGDAFIVVEKILAEGERLPSDWPVDGTTGYEVASAVDRLLVDGPGWDVLRSAAEDFTGAAVPPFRSLAEEAKREALASLFPQEVRSLARGLPAAGPPGARAAARRPADVEAAVVDVTAALPVYRTYFGDPDGVPASTAWLERAAASLRRRGRDPGRLQEAVLETIATSPVHESGLDWTRRWQRLTGAAAAKGVEDTAMYRYQVLLSRNEVGSEPDAPPLDARTFSERMLARLEAGQGGLSATSTHDSKRDEDARARLHVLSERSREWTALRWRWHELNAPLRSRVGDRMAPDPAEEELIYQTLLASWPLETRDEQAALGRLRRYVTKALREAKRHTSWIDGVPEYEAAVESFVTSALAPGRPFRDELRTWARSVAASGAVNALAMVLLRTVVPGVPDTYQGTELWMLPKLVDPDNRGAVDFTLRRRLLDDLDRREAEDRAGLLSELAAGWSDGRLKLYVLSRALRFRSAESQLFARGEFLRLAVSGPGSETVVALARRRGDRWAVCVVPRLSDRRRPEGEVGGGSWDGLRVLPPPGSPSTWTDVLSGRRLQAGLAGVPVSDVFASLPVALFGAA